LAKLPKKLHVSSELIIINNEIIPLKALADKERRSIYGLTGLVYTPHIDAYMLLSVKKAKITACLKAQGVIPISEVERISAILDVQYKGTRSNTTVEYNGEKYKRQFSPLKLTKSGKNVQKWAKFWLLQTANERADPTWENQVREIWPSYFLIRTIDL
jgi:hypothetical protein